MELRQNPDSCSRGSLGNQCVKGNVYSGGLGVHGEPG